MNEIPRVVLDTGTVVVMQQETLGDWPDSREADRTGHKKRERGLLFIWREVRSVESPPSPVYWQWQEEAQASRSQGLLSGTAA